MPSTLLGHFQQFSSICAAVFKSKSSSAAIHLCTRPFSCKMASTSSSFLPSLTQSYLTRSKNQSNKNAASKLLLETISRKRSNLCVSVDVTKKQDLLDVVDAVAKDVCLIKVSN